MFVCVSFSLHAPPPFKAHLYNQAIPKQFSLWEESVIFYSVTLWCVRNWELALKGICSVCPGVGVSHFNGRHGAGGSGCERARVRKAII